MPCFLETCVFVCFCVWVAFMLNVVKCVDLYVFLDVFEAGAVYERRERRVAPRSPLDKD